MARLASDGIVTGFMAQPRRTLFLWMLLTICLMGAVAQKGVGRTNPTFGTHYSDPAVQSVNYVVPALVDNRPNSSVIDDGHTSPVLAGNYPDPSVIRVGQEYWATATSSGWAPLFPIMHSRDLVNWQIVGSVFQQRPSWSDGNYWAPEITRYRGRYYVYYVGRKIGGPRCVAVATARRPIGPYKDHGPLVCQKLGSIDPMAVTDENGWRYLVWKRGGNTRNLPTAIWAQRLSRDGLRLIGPRTELIRNDAPWEAKVVEGPFILRRDGWFYMFYSGDDCCSIQCNYALGVARAPYLLGPWEKNPANPILKGNEMWKCPGHGSIVADASGRDYLLYHAYQQNAPYIGRQALLAEVKWGANQWPTIDAIVPSGLTLASRETPDHHTDHSFVDDFTSQRLRPGWQWPQANQPSTRMEQARRGWLALSPTNSRAHDVIGAVVARATTVGNYVATTAMNTRRMKQGTLAGLAAYGDNANALGIAVGGGKVIVWRREKNDHKTIAIANAPRSPLVHLRMTATDGRRFRFAVGNGRNWKEVGDENGNILPPWDHAVRVALTSGGVDGAAAQFDWLRIAPLRQEHTLLAADS